MKGMMAISIIILLTVGCSSSNRSIDDLYEWLNDEGNGLLVSKSIGDVEFEVKYLPPSILAFREMDGPGTQEALDSLTQFYSNQESFILTIKSSSSERDIVYRDVQDHQDYNQRINDLSFNLRNLIILKTTSGEFTPSLYHYERSYSLNKSNSIILVFADDGRGIVKSDTLDLVIQDEIFNTGINHFVFRRGDIQRIPRLDI